MRKAIPCLIIMFLMVGCKDKPGPLKAKANKDPKIDAAEEKINKTSPEGKEIIEKVQGMKPEVNEQLSAMTLREKAEDFTKNKGDFGITPIGWEAAKKKTNERWKVVFYYQDYQKQLLAAEWEYDPKAEKVYPFEFNNAPGFFESAPPAQGTKGKK